MRKVLAMILGGTLLAIAIPFLIFLYGEIERDHLINRYRAPVGYFLKEILSKRQGSLDLIMKDKEVIMCAIDGYGRIDQIAELNAKQKASLPKDKLPSEDLTLYLLFFANDSISRVYFIDRAELGAINIEKGGVCASREDRFIVETIKDANGDLENILNISKGMK
jgi:hypothetical protein